jgi:ABC-type transport system involved in multi-copper enzyme maturation permease subunit
MSTAQAISSWFRRTFRWSNSRQSWEERVGALILLAGAGGAFWLGGRLSALQQVLLWTVILLTSAVLLRRGWLKLFGPVLFYDMVRSARRSRHVWIRCVYAGLLLFLLFSAFLSHSWGYYDRYDSGLRAARIAQSFFEMFIVAQMVAVTLLTPAYVAGAIAEEKDRKTLEFLLATDLRNREIVLSKLVARLGNLTLFILTGLPLVSILQFLGGIEPSLVLTAFAATALTALALGGVSILCSTWFKRPRDAIAVTYLFLVAYLAISFATAAAKAPWTTTANWGIWKLPLWFGEDPFTFSDLVDAFNTGNFLLVFDDVMIAADQGKLDTVLPVLLGKFALFTGLVAGVTTLWAVLRLRAVALQQMYGKAVKRSLAARLGGRPAVGDQPMLWKEVLAEGGIQFNWVSRILVAVLVCLSFLPTVLILWDYLLTPYRQGWMEEHMVERINILQVRVAGTIVGCLMLLAVAVRASTAYSTERDRQTLDSLLTTPLDSTTILWAKWLGAIASVRLGWIWLALIWGVGIALGALHPVALPLTIVAWLVYAAFAATLGLWFSVVSRTSLRATVWTLLTLMALGVGHWLPWVCCVPILMPYGGAGIEYIVKFQAGLTPPFALGVMPFCGEEFRHSYGAREMAELLFFSLFGLFVWGVGTVVLWSGLTLRFRAITNRDNLTRPERPGYYRPRPVRLTPAEEEPAPEATAPPSRDGQPPPEAKGARLIEDIWEKPREREE